MTRLKGLAKSPAVRRLAVLASAAAVGYVTAHYGSDAGAKVQGALPFLWAILGSLLGS